MELYDTDTFLNLVPAYHEKKADVFLMFFRMNNIALFEVCRTMRQEFEQMIQSEAFKTRFEKEFFVDDEINAEKYAKFILHLIILMNRYILQQFQNTSLQRGGTRRRIRHSGYKVPQTQSRFNKSRSQRHERKQAKENPRGQSHFSSPFADQQYERLWELLFFESDPKWRNIQIQRLANKEKKEYLQLLEDEKYISLALKSLKGSGELLLFITLVAPIYLVLMTIRMIFRSGRIDRFMKQNKEVFQIMYLTFQFTSHVVGGVNSFLARRKQIERAKALIQQIERAKAFTQQIERVKALENEKQQSMVRISTLSANMTSTLPPSVVLETNITLASGTMGNVNTMHDLYEEKGLSNAVQTLELESNKPYASKSDLVCQASEPLSEPTGTTVTVNQDLLTLTRYIHSISLTNISAGEYGFLMILDENTGELHSNNTITTSFERGSTCVTNFSGKNKLKCHTNSKIPQNAAIAWHFHPWDVDRFVSHQSVPDLKHTLFNNFVGGIPYGAAHAPEGIYIYTAQSSTVEFMKRMYAKNPNNLTNVWNKYHHEMNKMIDSAGKTRLECTDLRSRNITQFQNLGKITVEVDEKTKETDTFEFGMNIQFINQKDLSNKRKIDLSNYEIFKEFNPWNHKKIPAQEPMLVKDLWNELFDKVFSGSYAKSVGKDNYKGLLKLPNPFEGQVSSKDFRKVHPYPIEKMQQIILQNPKLFILFQKGFRTSLYPRRTIDGQDSIELHFMDVYKRVTEELLKDRSDLYSEQKNKILSDAALSGITRDPVTALYIYIKGMFFTEFKKTDEIKKQLTNLQSMLNNLK